MNQVASLFSSNAINQLQSRKAERDNIMFPVALRPLTVVVDGKVIETPNRTVIYRSDTDRVLGVHKGRYKLQTNEEIFGAFEEAVLKSNLDTAGMLTRDQISHEGARCLRTYRFPMHRTEVKVGDITELQIVARNSYDGDWAVGFEVQGMRLKCTNGMVVADKMNSNRRKHTSGFDLQAEIRKLNTALEVYSHTTKEWGIWLNKKVNDEQAQSVFKVISGNETFLETMNDHWLVHKEELGPNMWGLYNTLTYWSSHQKIRPSSNGNAPSIIMDREEKVARAISSPNFLRLAA